MFERVHPELGQVLALLDGCHRWAEISATSLRLGVPVDQLDWAVRTLHEAGLLHERSVGSAPTDDDRFRVRLLGAGRLGKSVAELLPGSAVSVLHVIDSQPPDASLYPAAGAVGSQAEALVGSLEGASGIRLHVANHWSKPEQLPPDLTIIASDLMECDRVIAEGLMRADQPHLFIRAGSGGVVVGPLVVPGQTACLRCTDVARRDADPAWPRLLPQLARARARVAPVLASWAGGVATAQALAFLHGSVPETYGATIDLSASDYLTRRRSWAMHPGCGCGWGTQADWGE